MSSDFYMVGIVEEGFGTPAEEFCCFPFAANWAFADSENLPEHDDFVSPLNFDELRTEVGAFIGLFAPLSVPRDPHSGVVNITTNYGMLTGDRPPYCDSPGNDNTVAPTSSALEMPNTAQVGIRVEGPQIIIDNRASHGPLTYRIYDLSGRLLSHGQVDAQQPFRIDATQVFPGVQNAMLIVEVHDGQRSTTQKVYVSTDR